MLENFDAMGKTRTIDRFARTEIDMLGTLPDGTIVRKVRMNCARRCWPIRTSSCRR